MNSRISPAGRGRARGGRAILIAVAAVVSAAALVGCGGARADLSTPGPAQTPTKAESAPEKTAPSKPIASAPERPIVTRPVQPSQAPKKEASANPHIVQKQLASLGYLPAGVATGTWDARTTHAVLAFQAWEGLARDGIVGPQTLAALEDARRPTPTTSVGARHVEVHREKGVTLLVEQGRVVRALHSSSGGGANATPAGSYSIFRKELNSWSVPYRVWLPYASYFNAGIAFHGYPDVPAYPASHGCVRLPSAEAPTAYAFMSVGTPVTVY
jgi:lipoprotein-anchoring transpeptidase ErfK/SrfK